MGAWLWLEWRKTLVTREAGGFEVSSCLSKLLKEEPVVASFLLVKWDAISGAKEPKNYHHTSASEIPSSRGRTRTAGQVTAL